jgi:hypothetical protein
VAPPEPVAEHDEPRIALGGRLTGCKTAAERHRHTHDVEEVGRHDERHDRHRHVAAAPVDTLFDAVARNAGESAALVQTAPAGI